MPNNPNRALKNVLDFTDIVISTQTSGSILKSGTSGTPISGGTTADRNFYQIYLTSAATTGTTRGIYNRLYLTAGAGGESLRAFTTVSNDAPVDTVNGAHISLSFGTSAGNITGLGTASRNTLHIPGRAINGTITAVQAEIFGDAASGAIGGTASFIRMLTAGHANLTDSFDTNGYIFDISGLTANTGKVLEVGTGMGTVTGTLRFKLNGANAYLAYYSAAG